MIRRPETLRYTGQLDRDYFRVVYFSDQIDLSLWLTMRAGTSCDELRQHFLMRSDDLLFKQKVTRF